MINEMLIGELFDIFDAKVPTVRHINVVRDNKGDKIPCGEKNNMTPGDIMMNRGHKGCNTYSFAIKYIQDLHCVDFDTKKLNDCDLYNHLINNDVGFTETPKGYHFYIYIKNIDNYDNETKISSQHHDIDLITQKRNIWETKTRKYFGNINNVKTFEWEDIKHYFNIKKMNFVTKAEEDIPPTVSMILPKCSSEELIKHVDKTKILTRIKTYDDWLTLGAICFNNFEGGDEGFKIWNQYSEKGDNYCGLIKLMDKYKTFNVDRDRLVSYKRLLKWNAEDYPCNNIYESHYRAGDLIEYMNETHAFYKPTGEFFTFQKEGLMRQRRDAFMMTMANKIFKDEDKEICPAKLWIKDLDRHDITEIIFDPSGKCLDYQLNLWAGFEIKNTGQADINKVQHILDHIKTIWADGNIEIYNYLIGWFASILQTPGDKNGICVILKSIQGVGKTSVLDLFNKIIGKKYSISLSNFKLILGDFNGDAEGKLLVNINESGMWYDKKMAGAFKEYITDPTITINHKGIKSYTIDNYANIIITTNEDHIVGVSSNDRRFNIIQCADTLYDDEYYERLRDTDIQELANYFYNVDITEYNPRKFTKGELYKQQQILSFNSVEIFIMDMIEGDVYSPWTDPDQEVGWEVRGDLYNNYENMCKSRSHVTCVHPSQFFPLLRKIINIEEKKVRGTRLYKLPEYEEAKQQWESYTSK